MRPRPLFFAKLLGYSLILLFLWPQISQVYLFLLKELIKNSGSLKMFTEKVEKGYFSTQSLYMVPFISLILSTSKMPHIRKAGAILFGVVVFLVEDFAVFIFLAQDEVFSYDLFSLSAANTYFKVLAPFVLWMIPGYPYMGELLLSRKRKQPSISFSCPLCEEMDQDIIEHIKGVHGEKSLKLKKVRKFLSENPHVSSVQ